nr:glycosyltransferase [Tessaracoccus coleopterorum]
MRIAILIDDFFPASGGIGRSVQTQLEELTKMGHEVTLVAPDRHLQKPRLGRIIECPTIYLEGLPAHLSVLHCTDRRARLISSVGRFDIVHSQTERGALVLGARIARLQSIPHLHTFHANIAGTHQTVRGPSSARSATGRWCYRRCGPPPTRRRRRRGCLPAPTRREDSRRGRIGSPSPRSPSGSTPTPSLRRSCGTSSMRPPPGRSPATWCRQGTTAECWMRSATPDGSEPITGCVSCRSDASPRRSASTS